eukprot:TRINITY_DN16694_c0_g1_i1.p1 TRINITY_DN16694_c0_g1~~TRINITY_DN16694_c0_g1_i1.p1  ORF type:complete len:344 (+),score=84.87 TRINITY_DN16694_c0_g1_i1:102-1133(+)
MYTHTPRGTVMRAVFAAAAVSAAAATPPVEPDPQMFPQGFTVATGTTIPHNGGLDSVTQHGVVHYDLGNQRVRMDHAWQDKKSSFIADFREGKLYSFKPGQCVVMLFNGTLEPFGIPKGALLHEESALVRDTVVRRYEGVIRTAEGRLQMLDFYVKKMNRSAKEDTGNWIPWRTTYSRSLRKELGSAPVNDGRDWRYYGERNDEVAVEGIMSREVVPYEPGLKVITDYYNFHAVTPDADVFRPPRACREPGPRESFDFSFFAHGHTQGFGQQVFEFQKTLTDISQASPEYRQHLDDRCSAAGDSAEEADNHPIPRDVLERELEEERQRRMKAGEGSAEDSNRR